MAAAKAGEPGGVRRLISGGAGIDERALMLGEYDDGYTPLGVAARDGRADLVRFLLNAGANPRRVDGLMKATPGHKAGYMGHAEVARALTEQNRRGDGLKLQLDAQSP